MMSGSVRISNNGDGHVVGPGGNGKSLRMSPRATPLQRFVDAKQRINGIFKDLEEYVTELTQKLDVLLQSHEFIDRTYVEDIRRYYESVLTIQDMLKRDHMKVVFFGRTSNGKSTVVNAMLHAKVLPQGIGHTTRCFLQVEGSPSGEKYILKESSTEKISLESIDQLAHALEQEGKLEEMGEDTMYTVFWPKSDSKLLQNDVVLLDSPGVDVSPEFDGWIDKHCLDADVFVLVANSEATLTQAEKNFFHRVSTKLSKPNIFVLNNRWDASAAEPERVDAVKQQHLTQFKKFLVEELQVCRSDDAENRIFFVSAREVLTQRLKSKGIHTPTSFFADGHMERSYEFEGFEHQFETCISKSAIRTKFAAHIQKGKDIASDVHSILENIHSTSLEQKQRQSQCCQDKLSELRQSQASLYQFLSKSKEEIQRLSAEVQLKVSSDFTEEIRRLDSIIDSFDRPFSDEKHYLTNYKRLLTDHVDGLVTRRLSERCTGGLLQRIIGIERDMVSGVSALLPTDYAGKASSVVQYREPFHFVVAIDCHSYLSDFDEDLEFRFSFGLSQIIRRFAKLRRSRPRTSSSVSEPGPSNIFGHGLLPQPVTRSDSQGSLVEDLKPEDDVLMHSLILSSASYVANGGVGLLLIGGLVYRTVGWRVIAVGAGVYFGLYAYERLRWNLTAKEGQFKKQFRSHLSGKLKQLSHTHTMNCDHQVTKEVQEVLSRLQGAASEVHQNMKNDVDKVQKELNELEKLTKELSQTKKVYY